MKRRKREKAADDLVFAQYPIECARSHVGSVPGATKKKTQDGWRVTDPDGKVTLYAKR